jgi:hypothetical protein
LAATLLGLGLLVAQGYRDNVLISGVRAQADSDRHAVADAKAARAAAEAHDDRVTGAAVEVLKQFKALQAEADRCRI